MNYCSNCGSPVNLRVPPGDDRPRFFCDACKTIHYQNPNMVVGCIPEWEDRILLCRRSIEPRYGLWTLPAGFLENGESVSEGVKREAFEEARADVDLLDLFALFSLPQINQVYLIFRSRLISPSFSAGEETLELRLFSEEEIPWKSIAFKAIQKGLELYFQDRSRGEFPLHIETIELPWRREPK